MKSLEANSVDSVVTDPPYGLKFMGKKWDSQVPSVEIWLEVIRVLKPGGHLLSFFGTRTYHRGVTKIEDAGFEIRDQIQWIYGSGFPKSLDISKAIDKQAGAEREVVGRYTRPDGTNVSLSGSTYPQSVDRAQIDKDEKLNVTAPATPDAIKWQGFGTALKPANEPIVLARKPISEKTVALNVLKWGCGGLNIDASRIGTELVEKGRAGRSEAVSESYGKKLMGTHTQELTQGRFPANILFDECAAEMLDEQSIAGGIHSAGKGRPKQAHVGDFGIGEHGERTRLADHRFDDNKIGASRFFYCAKSSKSERNAGLEGMPERKFEAVIGSTKNQMKRMQDGVVTGERSNSAQANHHPTVKPIKLMQYLIKLITPPNGTVLDPFMGSGSTGVACKQLGFKFIGIEKNGEYCEIANKRISHSSCLNE